jgi:C4-type Zn-finger protein
MEECIKCKSNDIKKTNSELSDYGGKVIKMTYTCNNCNYQQSKTKAFGKSNKFNKEYQDFIKDSENEN